MPEEITYYAIIDDYSTADEPAGVLRRFADGNRRDESFASDLEWKFSSLRHAAEQGDTQYDLIPISAEKANQIVARLQAAAHPNQ